MTIRVTVEDTEAGTSETREIVNDYLLITAGRCYEDSIQAYPKSGTHVITIKGVGGHIAKSNQATPPA